MGLIGSIFGGLNDGRPGMFSQWDGSNELERLLQGLTGSQPRRDDAIGVAELPPAQPNDDAPGVASTDQLMRMAGIQPMPGITPAAAPAPQLGAFGRQAPSANLPLPAAAAPPQAAASQAGAKRPRANLLDYLVYGPDANFVVAQRAQKLAGMDLQRQLMSQVYSALSPGAASPGDAAPGVTPGGAAPPATPTAGGGLSINDPRLAQIALIAKQAGLDISDVIDVLKAQQPNVQFDRGWGYNTKTGASVGGYHPELDKNQEPLYDQYGRIVGVRNMDGAEEASARMAGAQADAQEAAKAHYDIGTPIQASDGSTVQAPRDLAADYLRDHFAQRYGRGGRPIVPQSGGAPGGAPVLGQSQTPGDHAAAVASGQTEGEAGAKARVDYPAVAQRAMQSITLIDDLIKDPHLKDRVGWGSKWPAIPGSTDPGIEAKLSQLQGTTFLQAYNELKGAGAITEIEGSKAEAAIARLQRRDQSYPDYLKALRDLRGVISSGIGRAQQRAQMGGGSTQTGVAPSGAPSGGAAPVTGGARVPAGASGYRIVNVRRGGQ